MLKKAKGTKEKEKTAEPTDFPLQPALDPEKGAGWTPHNLLVWGQHNAYIDCCLVAGIVSGEAKESYVASLRTEVEANDGEIIRQKKVDEEYAVSLAQAAAKKEAIERQSLREVCCPGKGDGKGSKVNPRYTAIPKKHNEHASVAAIAALAARANAAEVVTP